MASQTATIPLLASSAVAHYASSSSGISSPNSVIGGGGSIKSLNSTRFVGQHQHQQQLSSSASSFSFTTSAAVLSSSTSNCSGNTSTISSGGRNTSSSHCDVVSTSTAATQTTSAAEGGNAGGKQQQQQRVAAVVVSVATSAPADHQQHQRPQSRATVAAVVQQSLYDQGSSSADSSRSDVVEPTSSFTPSAQHCAGISSMTANGASVTSPATSNNNNNGGIGGGGSGATKRTTRHQHNQQQQQYHHKEENVAGRSPPPLSFSSIASSSPHHVLPHHHHHRATTTPEPPTPASNVMHLRNRPLKAATADDHPHHHHHHHHQSGSSVPPSGRTPTPTQLSTATISASAPATSTTSTSSGRPGRPPGKRRRRSSALNASSTASAAITTTTNGKRSPSIEELLLEQQQHSPSAFAHHPASQFFPLTTIGSVCEFFHWQMGGCSAGKQQPQQSYDATELSSPDEPDLALVSIVLGLVEANLTTLETLVATEEQHQHHQETTTTTNCQLLSSVVTTVDNHHHHDHQPDQHQHQHSNSNRLYGGHSPAEGTPAPSCVGSADSMPAASTTTTHAHSSSGGSFPLNQPMPAVHWATVQAMLDKFTTQIKESVDLARYVKAEKEDNNGEEKKKPPTTTTSVNHTSRELIRKITDVIWSNLNRSTYKDRPHLQTLYSYLSGGRLDAYGVAYTVVAACQLLGLADVRLVMSEDHTWVLFADGETCEVTWHGKGNEDRLGEPVPGADSDSWLYLNGQVLVCDRYEAVATAVNAMNPSLSATGKDSEELVLLQRQLLGILYEGGHLRRYPMALGNLGDLEDICRSSLSIYGIRSREPLTLFKEAIESARKHYDDGHVYPYTYMGGYLFRLGRFKDALHWWSLASAVVRRYSYSKEDEEIYNEFKEIANDLVPNIVKLVSARHFEPANYWLNGGGNAGGQMARLPLLQDPDCFAALVRFYDGLCCWEEGASTPVLHIGWTKPLVATINKFDWATRRQVAMKVEHFGGGEAESDYESDQEKVEQADEVAEGGEDSKHHLSMSIGERRRRRAASENSGTGGGHQQHGHALEEGADLKNASSAANTNGHRSTTTSSTKRHFKSEPADGGEDSAMASSEDETATTTTSSAAQKKVVVVLSSKKFAGLRSLLTAEKLNTSAIQLQLTAQSQVNVNRRSRSGTTHKVGHQLSLGPELDFVSTTTTTLARTNSHGGSGGSSVALNNHSNNQSSTDGSAFPSSSTNGAVLSGSANKRFRRE